MTLPWLHPVHWLCGLALSAAQPALAVTLTASLDYGTFQGAYNVQYNISFWQKIPFAAPPLEAAGRFRAPQPPLPVVGVYNSTQPFSACPSRDTGSEDCLYLGLYSRPWTAGEPLKPVVVNFYGGGFVYGGASMAMPPSGFPVLNVSGSTDILFVHPNYRINVFGFLSGREVAADPHSDLNAGLLDQEAALKWVQRHIANFGGDPYSVSIWGQSAGAGSVIAQVIGRKHDPPLFKQALASSPYWPKTYTHDSLEAQALYNTMVNLTGCAATATRSSLQCLKTANLSVLQAANTAVVSSHLYTTSQYTWAPVIDGVFLAKPLSAVTPADINADLVWGMHNTREGDYFMPASLKDTSSTNSSRSSSSEASFNLWLRGYLPTFSDDDIRALERIYPTRGSAERLSWSDDDTFTRAGLVYRDSVLACPAFWLAELAAADSEGRSNNVKGDSGGGWVGEYSIPPANHASDTAWWYLPNQVQQSDLLHYHGFTGAFASFFQTGDPNALKLTNSSVPEVPAFASRRQFVVTPGSFETAAYSALEERCRFWKGMGEKVPF
ncbi:carboxylesterase [Lasiosphaeria hispida]|uniref:Carboxylic ester hydrolase n=1 Tax=Lasiosphaeria hispida TaxID=260671 RepID=A0AAJ0H5B3_9PEZI|nr:carboxylesterase [Lasiosphaeria hispida]